MGSGVMSETARRGALSDGAASGAAVSEAVGSGAALGEAAVGDAVAPGRFEPRLKLLFHMDARIGGSFDGGEGPTGRRILDQVGTGTFAGERLRGRLAPGSGDWRLLRTDGISSMDARVILQTDDGAVIHMSYGGRVRVPADLIAAVRDPARRGEVDPGAYYLRTQPTFETGAPAYRWLNDIVCLGVGRLTPQGVAYEVYEVL